MSRDPRAIFRIGAEWWAKINMLHVHPEIADQAQLYYPNGRIDGRGHSHWPPNYYGSAFVNGARQQEFLDRGAAMWESDVRDAEREALRRWPITERFK